MERITPTSLDEFDQAIKLETRWMNAAIDGDRWTEAAGHRAEQLRLITERARYVESIRLDTPHADSPVCGHDFTD